MKWSEVRRQFPNRCVLIEALNARTESKERIIKDMSVIDDFDYGNEAWKAYKQIHEEDPSRELYIFHTKNEKIRVVEQPYLGVRRKI